MAMGGGGSTYRSADGIWHAAIDIEPDRATGRRRRLTAQGKTKAVANVRLRMKLDAYVRKEEPGQDGPPGERFEQFAESQPTFTTG